MVPVSRQVQNRAQLRFAIFLLLAIAVTGILFARRVAMKRALGEMRREWHQALADRINHLREHDWHAPALLP